jgi:hypothetical protein
VLLNALLLTEHNAFPVLEDVENNTGLRGLVTRAMLQRVLRIVLEKTEQDERKEEKRQSRLSEEAAPGGPDAPPGSPPPLSPQAHALRSPTSFSLSRRVSATVVGLGDLFTNTSSNAAEGKPAGFDYKRRESKGKAVIDDWSFEGLDASSSTRSQKTDHQTTKHRGSVDNVASTTEHAPSGGERSKSSHAREGEFMSTVAHWMNSYTAGKSLFAPNASNDGGNNHLKGSISVRLCTLNQVDT